MLKNNTLTIFRFLVAGSTGALTNIFLLYIFTDYFKIYYLISTAVSFILATMLSFVLQKFWTFQNKIIPETHKQALFYFIISSLNFFINIGLMYLFVDVFGAWYIFAQIITSGLIAISSFMVYRYIIFVNDNVK